MTSTTATCVVLGRTQRNEAWAAIPEGAKIVLLAWRQLERLS